MQLQMARHGRVDALLDVVVCTTFYEEQSQNIQHEGTVQSSRSKLALFRPTLITAVMPL
jgi:hypothetical protein